MFLPPPPGNDDENHISAKPLPQVFRGLSQSNQS
jgi:hypothetical protein